MENSSKSYTLESRMTPPPTTKSTTEDEPRLWPSERIPQGGLFHTPKIQYSKETADLLKCKK